MPTLFSTSKPSVPTVDESARTTITPLAPEGDSFGWLGLQRFHASRPCPRIPTPSVDVAKAIPTASEKKAGQAILEKFSEAESLFHQHNSEPLLRAHDRSTNAVEKHKIMGRVAAMDPEKSEQVTWAMHAARREAASLAAVLTRRLGEKLYADLKATTEALEDELDAKGIPISESHYQSRAYVTTYTLHTDPRFTQAQLVWLLAVHNANRLQDEKFVAAGCAQEFQILKWFLGQREECPLSVS